MWVASVWATAGCVVGRLDCMLPSAFAWLLLAALL
jgi:hypothetical protein